MAEQRKSLFERLVLKEKIAVLKRVKAMTVLEEELVRTQNLCRQLTEIADSGAVLPGLTTPLALRSANHYGMQVHEQLTTASNRTDFLEDELAERQRLLAEAINRHRKISEKQAEQAKQQRQEKADKALEAIPAKRSV